MSRTPITLRGLLKVVGGKRGTDNELAYPPPPRWDDREDTVVAMAVTPAPTPTWTQSRAPRSLALGSRRPIAAPRRAA